MKPSNSYTIQCISALALKWAHELTTSIKTLQNKNRSELNAFVSHKVRTNPIINDEYPNLKQETKLVYVHPINTTKHKQTMAWDELNQDHSKSEVGSFKWPPNNPYSNDPKSTINPLKTQVESAWTQNLLTMASYLFKHLLKPPKDVRTPNKLQPMITSPKQNHMNP